MALHLTTTRGKRNETENTHTPRRKPCTYRGAEPLRYARLAEAYQGPRLQRLTPRVLAVRVHRKRLRGQIEIESGQIEDESGELHDISELLDSAAERLDQAHQEWLEARKHAVRHQDRDEALQIVIAAAGDLADYIEREDEELEDTITKIRAAIEAVEAETQEPSPPFYACPDCGCTDLGTSAWVSVNTNQPTNDEGPTDEVYCPQCDSEDKQYALGKHKHLVEVDALQPFIKGW